MGVPLDVPYNVLQQNLTLFPYPPRLMPVMWDTLCSTWSPVPCGPYLPGPNVTDNFTASVFTTQTRLVACILYNCGSPQWLDTFANASGTEEYYFRWWPRWLPVPEPLCGLNDTSVERKQYPHLCVAQCAYLQRQPLGLDVSTLRNGRCVSQ
jgi:hypothetical protein